MFTVGHSPTMPILVITQLVDVDMHIHVYQTTGPGFDTRFGHILLFLLPLIQEGQLSVTGGSMCTKY